MSGKGLVWGAKRTRLAQIFEKEHGFKIETIIVAQGRWRSDDRFDVMRWEAYGRKIGGSSLTVWFGSWDTITDCVRYGFTLTPDEQWLHSYVHTRGFNVDVKDPPKRTAE